MTDSPTADDAHPAPAGDTLDPETLARAQDAFTAALPKIRNKAGFYFRHLPPHLREDAIAAAEAFAWQGFLVLTAQGRETAPLLGKIAEFSARRVRHGARFGGRVLVRDALSAESRRRRGYTVTSLPRSDDDEPAAEVSAALGRRAASPAEEAIARLDFEAWLDGLDDRRRTVAEGFLSGAKRKDLARQLDVTPERIRQIRVELRRSYEEFQGGRER